jgi:CRP/FNR family transcriptional activator FtrB
MFRAFLANASDFSHKVDAMNNIANVSIANGSTWLECGTADLPLLGALPEPVRERLLEASRVERVVPREELFCGAEVPTHLHIVLSGIIDLSCTYKSSECTVLMMAAGDVFMPAAALYEERYLVSARALTPSRILMIDAEVVRKEARGCSELALALARVMAGQWRVALKIILDLKCRSPSQRLAAFLLRLHDAAQASLPAEVPFSKRQLASRIGMQPETLSRTLQTLASNGLYLRGRRIIVTNREAAEEFCGPDPYPPASEYEFGVHAL